MESVRLEAAGNAYPVDIVRGIDQCAIEDHGIPGYTLMTRAGQAAFDFARKAFPEARRWAFLAGPGNNAGDAYVVARLAQAAGFDVRLFALADPEALKGDAHTAASDYSAAGGAVESWSGSLPDDADVIVDGLFGSGLVRDIGGSYAQAIDRANAHPAKRIALDIASGIAGDTGHCLGIAFAADLTIAFVALKPGYFLGDGIDATGELRFAGLEVPAACYPSDRAVMSRIPEALLCDFAQPRRRNAHKGDFGHVLIAGGSEGMPGAALLAGMAALRSGAGRVTVATHASHASGLVARCPELMVRGIETSRDLEPLLERVDVVALGPGLGNDEWSQTLFERLRKETRASVWDAGALPLLAKSPDKADDRVITPHPGEAGVLLAKNAVDIQADRLAAVAALAGRYGGVAVLKGAYTLVRGAAGPAMYSAHGNPGMASAGMGDVLTGIIAGLRAQGLPATDAALLGVDVHARAGDLAAREGERGLIATDLIVSLRDLLNP